MEKAVINNTDEILKQVKNPVLNLRNWLVLASQ